MNNTFDTIIIGGGHAGTEAALAAARMGARTLLLTHNLDTLGQMSCNPAIGGIGKGHLTREIDAMGGAMAQAADEAGIHFRILNRRKGPAVRATRAQCDRVLYRGAIRKRLENQDHLTLFQQSVEDILIEGERVVGVTTHMGLTFKAPTVVLTTGTFLGGRIHIGDHQRDGGRAGDPPANTLATRLRELPFRVERLKTGTPPRIDGRTLNWEAFSEQPGDTPTPTFSLWQDTPAHPQQVSCFITHTTPDTHDIILTNRARSAMLTGAIEGVGPRYCPSIEDKVVRFADKNQHQIFIEPEGLNTHEIYPNGISTSLPYEVQNEFIQTITGFEHAHITRPGYAIEYDFFNPQDLHHHLETKAVRGLYFAGQINGTTGYEEAGAQGLLAGINAALAASDQAPWHPTRDQAYLGVLVDDLVLHGTAEPYRMFTSRAEHRLLLREDNADQRLTPKAFELGLINETYWRAYNEKLEQVEQLRQHLTDTTIRPEQTPSPTHSIKEATRAIELLKRPEWSVTDLSQLVGWPDALLPDVAAQVEIQTKYAGYIDRQQNEVSKLQQQETVMLPAELDYSAVAGLSNEVRQKLNDIRPSTLGQASRISGVTPAALSVLLIHLKKQAA